MEAQLAKTRDKQTRPKLLRRLKLFKAFQAQGIRPEWMVMSVLPVLPPALRPARFPTDQEPPTIGKVAAEGEDAEESNRSAAEDPQTLEKNPDRRPIPGLKLHQLNQLYIDVIQQNNEIKKLLAKNGDRKHLDQAKRNLQLAVDALLYGKPESRQKEGTSSEADPESEAPKTRGRSKTEPESNDEKRGRMKIRNCPSLADELKGKPGLFRQNLLGKRVDFSGRSAIVVGPQLKLNQCGLPKKIVLKLFEPFLVRRLIQLGYANSVRGAVEIIEHGFSILSAHDFSNLEALAMKLNQGSDPLSVFLKSKLSAKTIRLLPYFNRMPKPLGILLLKDINQIIHGDCIHAFDRFKHVDLRLETRKLLAAEPRGVGLARLNRSLLEDAYPAEILRLKATPPPIWDIVEEILREHPVMLNRAPTLHRLSIQAFEPVLVEGDAIHLHPMACGAFNADFDGDTMAVHLPLSVQAQTEVRTLMLAQNKFLSPANGKPAISATQDIVLGCHYLTLEPPIPKLANLPLVGSKAEAVFAYSTGKLAIHSWVKLANPNFGHTTEFGITDANVIVTTVGRILFSEVWPEELGFFNQPVNKSELTRIIWRCYKRCGHEKTMVALDKLKELGFQAATRAGISIGIDDLRIPEEKEQAIQAAQQEHEKVKAEKQGAIDSGQCDQAILRIWEVCKKKVSDAMRGRLKQNGGKAEFNPLWLMLDSGARGSNEQVLQLVGLRGLMIKGDKFIKTPVLSNFREGLSMHEFFISSFGARKTSHDRSRGTADTGYLTRKLVNAAMDVIIQDEDCGTRNGICIQALVDGDKEILSLSERLVGRVSCKDIYAPDAAGKIILSANQEITEELANQLGRAGIKQVTVRSVLTCESKQGVCAKCYGTDLGSGALAKPGDAIGIIAAQSIGEPATQLIMRTFHTGGTAGQVDITGGLPHLIELFEGREPKSSQTMQETLLECGLQQFHEGFVQAVQTIYRQQKVAVSDKHIEVILRQMLRKVRIIEAGDTTFLTGEQVEKLHWAAENERRIQKQGGKPSQVQPVLMGITKAMNSNSWLSNASFERTTEVLAEAAAMGKRDCLDTLKAKIITGGLIPAGTGFGKYRQTRLIRPE